MFKNTIIGWFFFFFCSELLTATFPDFQCSSKFMVVNNIFSFLISSALSKLPLYISSIPPYAYTGVLISMPPFCLSCSSE